MPEYRTVFRVASFKLHNPSRRKRTVIEHAFSDYTLSFDALLNWARDSEDLLEVEGKFERTNSAGEVSLHWSERSLAKVLRSAGVRPDLHSSLGGALHADVAESLNSYHELGDKYRQHYATYEEKKAAYEQAGEIKKLKRLKPPHATGFPSARDPRPGAFEEALAIFRDTIDVDEEEWVYRFSRLTRLMRGRFMPMVFDRPDGATRNRNFSLLVDDERGKYYMLAYLLPKGHALGQTITIDPDRPLRRVGTQDIFRSRTKLAVLCPLEMSDWHVREFLENEAAMPKRAILIERDGTYYFNVAFEYTIPAIEPVNVIGVDRGVAQLMALSVLDSEGNLLHNEKWSGDEFIEFQWDYKKELRRLQKRGQDVTGRLKVRRISEHTTHAIANRIANLALEYEAQAVLENLKYFDRRKEKFYRLRAAPYQSIGQKLDYKLLLRGLPKPRRVSPAYTSQMCSHCSHSERANRPDQETFICQNCGHQDHADLNAATNIALRWQKKQAGGNWWPVNINSS